jgi:hypothetical protein
MPARVCSFSAETPVATPEGDKPISDMEVGDQVLAYNELDQATDSYTVTAVLAHDDPVIVHLTLDDEQLETTPDHPFFTAERGWIPAGDLTLGEHIQRLDGSWGAVTALEFEQRTQTMYNLTVAVAHTFYVGEGQWLVHNWCGIVALGIAPYLDDFAQQVGGSSWKVWAKHDPDNWKQYFMEVMSNENNPVYFNLQGVEVWPGVSRASRGANGATDWELLMIKQHPEWWDRITFMNGSTEAANPFN